MILFEGDLGKLERRFRANFINSLGGFKSVVLIGTKSAIGNENLAIFSSLFHIGADPSLCGIVIRPNEEKQNTLGNIMATKQYTINHILPDFYKQAHQSSAKYEEGKSEFEEVGLTPEFIDSITAPFVKESKIKFACKLIQKIDIQLNGTFIIIGEIIAVSAPSNCVHEDGKIDLEQSETITLSGLDTYHITKQIARLSYAKTNKPVDEIH
ncbi:MAG: flavin reductase [Saprospiraceae bacterium]|nr:flavin reductase [Saprospiraceae bacterium]